MTTLTDPLTRALIDGAPQSVRPLVLEASVAGFSDLLDSVRSQPSLIRPVPVGLALEIVSVAELPLLEAIVQVDARRRVQAAAAARLAMLPASHLTEGPRSLLAASASLRTADATPAVWLAFAEAQPAELRPAAFSIVFENAGQSWQETYALVACVEAALDGSAGLAPGELAAIPLFEHCFWLWVQDVADRHGTVSAPVMRTLTAMPAPQGGLFELAALCHFELDAICHFAQCAAFTPEALDIARSASGPFAESIRAAIGALSADDVATLMSASPAWKINLAGVSRDQDVKLALLQSLPAVVSTSEQQELALLCDAPAGDSLRGDVRLEILARCRADEGSEIVVDAAAARRPWLAELHPGLIERCAHVLGAIPSSTAMSRSMGALAPESLELLAHLVAHGAASDVFASFADPGPLNAALTSLVLEACGSDTARIKTFLALAPSWDGSLVGLLDALPLLAGVSAGETAPALEPEGVTVLR